MLLVAVTLNIKAMEIKKSSIKEYLHKTEPY